MRHSTVLLIAYLLFTTVAPVYGGDAEPTAAVHKIFGKDRKPADQLTETSNWIAFIGEDRNVWLIHPDGTGLTQVTSDATDSISYTNLKWSPHGKYLGFERRIDFWTSEGIMVFSPTDGSTKFVLTGAQTSGGYDWIFDDDHMVFSGVYEVIRGEICDVGYANYQGLYLLELTNGTIEPFPLASLGGPILLPKASVTGGSLLFVFDPEARYWYRSPPTYLWGASTPADINLIPGVLDDCAWHPAGMLFACGGMGNLRIFLDTGEVQSEINDPDGLNPHNPVWSASGDLLAYNLVEGESHADGPCGGGSAPGDTPSLNRILVRKLETGSTEEYGFGRIEDWSPDSRNLLVKWTEDPFGIGSLIVRPYPAGPDLYLGVGYQAAWQPKPGLMPLETAFIVGPDLENQGLDRLNFAWTLPAGESFESLSATAFEVRFSAEPLTPDNWATAEIAGLAPLAGASGSIFQWAVSIPGLPHGELRYFAARALEGETVVSDVSENALWIDLGMRPIPDGYHFTNLDGKADYALADEHMIALFGEASVCSILSGDTCILNLPATVFQSYANSHFEKGLCFGMAATSLHFFLEGGDLSNLQPGAGVVHDLNVDTEAVRENIGFYHATEWAIPVLEQLRDQRRAATPQEVLSTLYASLNGETAEHYILAFYSINSESVGHAVTPYAISTSDEAGWWRVWVYDNAQKGSYIEVNPEANLWKTKNEDYQGDADSHSLILVPLSLVYGPQILPKSSSGFWIFVTEIGSFASANQAGQRFDYPTNNSSWEGAAAVFPVAGYDIPTDPVFYLPADEQIFVEVATQENDQRPELVLIGDAIQVIVSTAAQANPLPTGLSVERGGELVRVTPPVSTALDLTLSYPAERHTYALTLNQIPSAESASLEITQIDHQLLDISASGGSATFALALSVERGETNALEFAAPNIELARGATLRLDLSRLDDGELDLGLDEDGDGSIDRSEVLMVAGSDPGSGTSNWLGWIVILIGVGFLGIGMAGLLRIGRRTL